MSNTELRRAILCCAFTLISASSVRIFAQDDKTPADQQTGATKSKTEPAQSAADENKFSPLPPEKSALQSIVLDGRTLHYTVTVGAYPIRDQSGKSSAR